VWLLILLSGLKTIKSATNPDKVPSRAGFSYKDGNRSRKDSNNNKEIVLKFCNLAFFVILLVVNDNLNAIGFYTSAPPRKLAHEEPFCL
jgi:hypothetical protein